MKFALIIPTRGDRPDFITQCKKLIKNQSLQPTDVIWMNYKPESNSKDITQRYKRGVEIATKRRYDFVVFWEDDDWYHPDYLKWLISEWKKANYPNTFGVGETYYYHHGIKGKIHYDHPGRTSAFCTLVKLPVSFSWPADSYAFLDMHIYKKSPPITVKFPKDKIYAIGIKHGIGLSGGGGHRKTHGYIINENNAQWFYSHIGNDREFYDNLIPKIKQSDKNLQKINSRNVQGRTVINTNSNTQLRRGRFKISGIRKK